MSVRFELLFLWRWGDVAAQHGRDTGGSVAFQLTLIAVKQRRKDLMMSFFFEMLHQ